MHKVAIIDFGSNTARCVAFEIERGRCYRLVDELQQVVRLSEGIGEARVIRGAAFERGLDALVTFRSFLDAVGIDQVHAAATAAVREAKNGASFLRAARERADFRLQVLSGEQEAEAAVRAAANSLDVSDALVMDLGGGSVQLGRMRGRTMARGRSWPLGAVRTTEDFLSGNPPPADEIEALRRHTTDTLGTWLDDDPEQDEAAGPPVLVGVGGTLRNLARVHMRATGYPLSLMHGYTLPADGLEQVVDRLAALTVKKRAKVSGLASHRADIIVGGAVVIRQIVRATGASGVLVCGQGVREGMLYPYLFEKQPDHLADDVRRFSVLNLMRQYHDHPRHNGHVAHLSLSLFDQLQPLHGYGAPERELLHAAAMVHDIGMAIDYYAHHKHGMTLVMGRPLPGYTHREQAIIALLVRYHRKGSPSKNGPGPVLDDGDMGLVARLAGMLRLAEYLERSKAQRVRDVRCHVDDGYIQVEALAPPQGRVEVMEARRRSDLMAEAFSATVEVILGAQ